MLAAFVAAGLSAQMNPMGMPLPPPVPPASTPALRSAIPHPDAPPPGVTIVRAISKTAEGSRYRLRGKAEIETSDVLLKADEIDWDEETGLAEARGSVDFVNFQDGTRMHAARVDYDLKEERGTFYEVSGSTPGKFDYRPGVLTTGNPFLFQGKWAERIKERYFLYEGTLTNCTFPRPWWVLQSPRFDIIPGDRALAYKSFFKMRGVPILYAPVLYKSLSESPRKSGFLTPNFGNSNRRGLMYGLGYFWAINRSYDFMYRSQYFTQRGFAHTADFRGKPTHRSDFDFYFYGVNDRGLAPSDGSRYKASGYVLRATGKSDWGKGWYSKSTINYLSSFAFRQEFTESFNEAVFSEVNSIFQTSRDWSTYHFNAVFAEQENFQSSEPGDKISIRRLPQVEFISRDRELNKSFKYLPVWVSWNSSFGLVRRTQKLFQTRQFVERLDVEPRIMTALRWKDIHLLPYASLRETYYGSSWDDGRVTGQNVNRLTREFGADLVLPSIWRIYRAPKLLGERLKHTIEPRVHFRTVAGARDFLRIVRFDEMDTVANTSEVEVMVANRFYTKQKSGQVYDALSWEISQRRFFQPDFGGAVVAGQRNVVQSTLQMTAYTWLDQPRRSSPIVSVLRATPRPGLGVEWRADYDSFRGKLVNSSITADARVREIYFFSLGHNRVACIPLLPGALDRPDPCIGSPAQGTVLTPPSNQIRGMVGIGQDNRRGWNAGFFGAYDYRTRSITMANTQLTYNTTCCAYSFQWRSFGFGSRNENQFRVAFVIANIGSFGTLRRQDRLF